jgi:hypothetical protein
MLTVEAERAAQRQTITNYYKIVSPVQERGKALFGKNNHNLIIMLIIFPTTSDYME